MRVFNKLAALDNKKCYKIIKRKHYYTQEKTRCSQKFISGCFFPPFPAFPSIFFSLLRSDPLSRSGAEHRLSIFGAFRARESHMVQGGCKRSTSVEQNLKIEILRHNLKNCYFRAF